jgi:ribosomal protein S6E (S10)
MIGANVLELLVSPKEFDERIKALVKNEQGYWVKKKGEQK